MELGTWNELVVTNYDYQQHPWHIHGMEAHVIGYGYFDTEYPGWKGPARGKIQDKDMKLKGKSNSTYAESRKGLQRTKGGDLVFASYGVRSEDPEVPIARAPAGGTGPMESVNSDGEGAPMPCSSNPSSSSPSSPNSSPSTLPLSSGDVPNDPPSCNAHLRRSKCLMENCVWTRCVSRPKAQEEEEKADKQATKMCEDQDQEAACNDVGEGMCKWYGNNARSLDKLTKAETEFHYHPTAHRNVMYGHGASNTRTIPRLNEGVSSKTSRVVVGDTFTVPPNGFVVLRINANNPGAWFMHCHMEWHLGAG